MRRVVVLVEGESDRAAVRMFARRRGPGPGMEIRVMGGATNIRRHLLGAMKDAGTRRVLGLTDAAEAPYVLRALADSGARVTTVDDLASHGFHVCQRDLEDELIRALGTDRVQAVLETLGLHRAFELFGHQQAWRTASVEARLHRFAGTTSGRKSLLAEALAQAVPDDAVPHPLRRLLDQVAVAADLSAGPPLAPFPEPSGT